MEIVFKQLAMSYAGKRVLTQLFTCATAVNPILVSGLKPVYAEVGMQSLSIDPAGLVVPSDTCAVVIQNTFGIIDNHSARQLAALGRQQGAIIIEDSAHCLGRLALDVEGQPLADISIHSFGVEKMLPTKHGGAIWLNPKTVSPAEPASANYSSELRTKIAQALDNMARPNVKQRMAARTYRNQLRVLTRLPSRVSKILRSGLISVGIFDPAIAPIETLGKNCYSPIGMSKWVAGRAALHLKSIDATETQRSAAVATYRESLEGIVDIPAAIVNPVPLVRFPFFVRSGGNAQEIVDYLGRRAVVAGNWYRPALFPGVEDPVQYGYKPGTVEHERTEDLIKRVVNLPTDVSTQRALEIVELVKEAIKPTG